MCTFIVTHLPAMDENMLKKQQTIFAGSFIYVLQQLNSVIN